MLATAQYQKVMLGSGGASVTICADAMGEYAEIRDPLSMRGILAVTGGMYFRLLSEQRIFYSRPHIEMPEVVRFYALDEAYIPTHRRRVQREVETIGQRAKFRIVFADK